MNRNKSSAIWGSGLILFGIILLLESLGIVNIVGRLVWSLILMGIGVPFLLIFLSNKSQWWSLIPGCIMVGIGSGVLVGGQLSAIIITGSISLPFWLIYLADRENWWALIPGWTMASVSGIVFLGMIGLEWFVAPFVMFAIAIPFLIVYLLNRDQWWALIPGGIMASIGIFLLLGTVIHTVTLWPVFLIALGFWLIFRAFRPSKSKTNALPPTPIDLEDLDLPDPDELPDTPR